MKNKSKFPNLTLIIVFFCLIFNGSCKKDLDTNEKVSNHEITRLKDWFQINSVDQKFNRFKTMTPNWESTLVNNQPDQEVYEISLNNSEQIFQSTIILEKGSEKKFIKKNNIRLLIFKDKKTNKFLYGSYLSIIDERTGNDPKSIKYKFYQNLTGLVLYYNIDGSFANGWKYVNGKIYNPITASSETAMINSNFDKLSQIGKNNFDRGKLLKESSDPCLTGIPEYAVSCVGTNAYMECTYAITGYTYVSMCIGGGSYGDPGTYYPKLIDDPHNNGNGSITTKMTMPPPPEIPITDIIKYLSCFDKSKPASLTIYAEKIATSFPGHAFISIKQGSNTMVLGFYPKESFPSTVSGPGIMGDNGEHAYNSATNYGDISAEKLQKIINTIIKFSSSNYILTNNNCANFVLEVLKIMGVTDMTGICTPDNIYDITKPYATSMNGKAPKTQRTCN